jgi:hypothetical protein
MSAVDKFLLFIVLATEIQCPVRVILGYNGFASEFSLRESFFNYLEQNIQKQGFGPASFPNLVICKNYSLIKLNGLPYVAPIKSDYWNFFGSYSSNPFILLMELIWCRLSCQYNLPKEYFIDDQKEEIIKAYISAKAHDVGREYKYHPLSEQQLNETPSSKDWSPIFLNVVQAAILLQVCDKGSIDIKNSEMVEYIISKGYEIESFINELLDTRLVRLNDNILTFCGSACEIICCPDGSWVAANNSTGQLSRWFMKQHGAITY